MTETRPPPLRGIRVLDVGRVYLGPWCGLMLAHAGADVVKVESPQGDPARRGGKGAMTTVPFAMLNTNKRAITIDLKTPKGKELFVDLARRVDVVMENFAPGTMDDLGVGPDVLLDANPRLVYAAATGFGVDGPDRDQLAMDLTIQAYTGVMSVTGFPDQPPVKAGVAFTDILGGTHLYAGIVTALFERERTGRGRVVDVAMADAIYPTLASNMSGWYRDGVAPRSGNGHGGGALAPYNVYATSDGYVAIIVITEQQWIGLCTAMGQPELASDERFSSFGRRYYNIEAVDDVVGAWAKTLRRDDVVALCRTHKVPAAAVRDVGEVVEDRHLHERRALQRLTHPEIGEVVVPASPLRFRESPVPTLEPSPALGAHNDEIFSEWLGLSPTEIAALRDNGIV